MSSPIVIHILRPYATEEEYLASERFSIDSKSMLLIDQAPLAAETPVVFDVQLENGQKPIRAEAKVVGYVAPEGGRPGGLRVRFRRFGAATKAFIDRALREPVAPEAPEARPRPASIRPAPALVPSAALQADPAAEPQASAAERKESSGIHRRPVMPVAAPANRAELLERLRTRGRAAAQVTETKPGEQTG